VFELLTGFEMKTLKFVPLMAMLHWTLGDMDPSAPSKLPSESLS